MTELVSPGVPVEMGHEHYPGAPYPDTTLRDVEWLHLNHTNEYGGLKQDLALVVKDVQSMINEIKILDIIEVFHMHGFDIVRRPGATVDPSIPQI